jgi:hypothetical protein
MSLPDFLTILGMFAAGVIAALGAIWVELRSIRRRLHKLEGVGTFAVEVLGKYKLMRREDRDIVLDEKISKLGRVEE